jgi:uncharacterized protein (TIGR02453 family)
MSFTPTSFAFLKGLKKHNTRPWFEAHRADYEFQIKAPMKDLIEEMDVRLAKIAPEIVGDPKRSMFRIFRDVRFSKDKSPYKVHAACWFFHRDGRHNVGQDSEGGGAGYYFHFQPGECFTGGGLWMPPKPALDKLRDAIATDFSRFKRVAQAPALKQRFGGLDDENTLKRVPRGFDPEHPAAEWLKYQSFLAGRKVPDRVATSAKLGKFLEDDFKAMLPLVRWINGVLGLRPATRR